MKRIIVVISMILVLTILSVSITPVLAGSVTALDEGVYNTDCSKLDAELIKIVNTLSDDSVIPVTIWFNNAEASVFREALVSTFKEYGYKSNEMVIVDKLSQLEDDHFSSVDEYHAYSHIFRESRRNVYQSYNSEMVNRLNQKYAIHPTVIYRCLYTPSVILSISKAELCKIQNDNKIQIIFYHHEADLGEEDLTEVKAESCMDNTEGDRNYFPYGYWQHSTNIDTLRSFTGATGSGINVGLVENGPPDLSLPLFEDAVNHNRVTCLCSNNNPNEHSQGSRHEPHCRHRTQYDSSPCHSL